ncbi:hypothetical protein [Paenibacillus taichungensis]
MQNQENLRKALKFFKSERGNATVIAASLLLIRDEVLRLFPNSLDNQTLREILRDLGVFSYQKIDVMMETGTAGNIVGVTAATAQELASMALSLPSDKIHQMRWGENANKIIAEVQGMYPEWFQLIEEKIRLQNLISQFEREITSSRDRVLKIGAASVMEEKHVTNLKEQITKRFEGVKEKIEASDCPAEVKEKLISANWTEAHDKSIAHIDQKFAQEPVRVLYYRTGNRVAVKLGWENTSWRYHSGRGKEIRMNRGDDYQEYKLIVSLSYIEDFLYMNDISCEDVWVDENSIQACYRFNDKISVNLTPAFVREWYNYDAPTLERISPNIGKRGETMVGMHLCHFTTNLVEGWKYIAEDITVEEANALMKGYEHTGISKEIGNKLKARELEEAGQIEELKKWVEAYDEKIQTVIDANSQTIINALAVAFYDRVRPATGTDGSATVQFNDNFGFDCGFLNIQVNDSEYAEKRGILRNAISSVSSYMELKLPIFSQSTTFMRKQFEIVRDLVKGKTGIELIGHTVLD